mmetsp:Transcript_28303/g.91640  ORF Transcript_28303/g.91640 Transcript_28303/m.91640 type:complete len:217 (-) Transcript_28303:26-676(-)
MFPGAPAAARSYVSWSGNGVPASMPSPGAQLHSALLVGAQARAAQAQAHEMARAMARRATAMAAVAPGVAKSAWDAQGARRVAGVRLGAADADADVDAEGGDGEANGGYARHSEGVGGEGLGRWRRRSGSGSSSEEGSDGDRGRGRGRGRKGGTAIHPDVMHVSDQASLRVVQAGWSLDGEDEDGGDEEDDGDDALAMGELAGALLRQHAPRGRPR